MEIYFVRHGQTVGNKTHRHQKETSSLTPLGRQQASQAGERLRLIVPTHLLVSSRHRTQETAAPIAAATGVSPETNELFIELCHPARLLGRSHFSLASLWNSVQWYRGRVGTDGCTPEGESYEYFLGRLREAQTYLASLPPTARVVVVSHSIFINFFVAYMQKNETLSFWQAFLIFAKIKKIKNGSITRVTYTPGPEPTWELHSLSS